MYQYRAKFSYAVDGDTVDLDVDLGFHITVRDRFRLYGVNTPERGQVNYKEARDFVVNWFGTRNYSAYIESVKPPQDKYGRYLVIIRPSLDVSEQSLNDAIIQSGLGVSYYP